MIGLGKDKLAEFSISVFAEMAEIARQTGAINLAQGFPDYQLDSSLQDRVHHYAKAGFNQYAPMPGDAKLRQCLSKKYQDQYGSHFSPDAEITITTGAQEALFVTMTALLEEGDEVIYFEPAFETYRPQIILNKAVPVPIRLAFPDFEIPWEVVASKITSKTKLLVLNYPNNPTGKCLREEDILALTDLVKRYNIGVVSDEVYADMVFASGKITSLASIPALREHLIIVASLGKVLFSTGWRMGYVVAPPALTQRIRKVHQYVVFSACSHAMQLAAADYLGSQTDYPQILRNHFVEKRDQMMKALSTVFPSLQAPEGGFFGILDLSAYTDLQNKELAKHLAYQFGVVVIPMQAFYSGDYASSFVRICFTRKEEVLLPALNCLQAFAKEKVGQARPELALI